ncbi:uncharacterized protein K452DRAFT_6518 [Aplosporella prunicola CBS 121167]|uniref:Uncharacterized protein n=1 Tax=Aplosporella prunicola CBS 121167 TaxID=1176127 RepID=A0A6A6BTE0_9PEZI|nr:uncharacterized protein K452DRAFT_6518 [Aplosporella prunicola CBS 121167]KAF2147382.1 hypothetical protein K452DRAFT_6518 [Aplosporella prunicola CBS 121167]
MLYMIIKRIKRTKNKGYPYLQTNDVHSARDVPHLPMSRGQLPCQCQSMLDRASRNRREFPKAQQRACTSPWQARHSSPADFACRGSSGGNGGGGGRSPRSLLLPPDRPEATPAPFSGRASLPTTSSRACRSDACLSYLDRISPPARQSASLGWRSRAVLYRHFGGPELVRGHKLHARRGDARYLGLLSPDRRRAVTLPKRDLGVQTSSVRCSRDKGRR